MHTPTPWIYTKSGFIRSQSSDLYIAEVLHGPDCPDIPEVKDNAALIVRAVNAHADLVAALRECVTETPGAACYNTERKTRRLESINETVRAALAAAQE